MSGSRKPLAVFTSLVGLFAVIQLVPYGHDHTNPPPGAAPAWNSPRTLELAKRACFNCHSNETRWPWYASIAPVSWRIQTHVHEGRGKLNLTAFDPRIGSVANAAGEAGKSVLDGEMPPQDYMLLHPEARLTAAEKQALADGLNATFAGFVEAGEGGSAPGGGKAGRVGESGERREGREAGGNEAGEHRY